MKRFIEAQFGRIGFALGLALLLALGCYIGVGLITSDVDGLARRINRPPPTPARLGINCSASCPDGKNGTPGMDGPNGTCPVSCQNGTDGLNFNLTIILSGDNDTTVEILSLLASNLTVRLTENDTFVPIPGPQGPPGEDGANGVNGSQGPAGPPGRNGTNGANGTQGSHGVNGTCPACVNGSNGADGANGADGISHITVRTNNGTSITSYNTSFANITITVSPNSTFVSLGGQQGAPGADGQNGTNGANGVNATQCTPCVNGTNGVNGHNGTDGVNATGTGTNALDNRALGSLNTIGHTGLVTQCKPGNACDFTNTPFPVAGMLTSGSLFVIQVFGAYVNGNELLYPTNRTSHFLVVANLAGIYTTVTNMTVVITRDYPSSIGFICEGGPVPVGPTIFSSVGVSCTDTAPLNTNYELWVQFGLFGNFTTEQSSLSVLAL